MPSALDLAAAAGTLSTVKDALARTFSLESTFNDVYSVWQNNNELVFQYSSEGGNQAVANGFTARLNTLQTRINRYRPGNGGAGSIFGSNRRELRKILKELIQLRNEILPLVRKQQTEMLEEAGARGLQQAATGGDDTMPSSDSLPSSSDSSPTPSSTSSVFVELRPVPAVWSSDPAIDLDKELRALMNNLPRGYEGSTDIRATRITDSDSEKQPSDLGGTTGVILVEFPAVLDAIQFDNSWTSERPEGFENITSQILDV